MTGTALFFVLVGVGVATTGLMKFVEWLDAPRSVRCVDRTASASALTCADINCAELELERARLAA